MDFQSLVTNLQTDTLASLALFRPELAICATIVVMLLVRLFNVGQKLDPFWLAIAGALVAFWYALPTGGIDKLADAGRHEIFTGMLVYDSLTVYFRMFLLAFAFWFVILVRMTGLADKEDGQDFYSLLLGSTLGMCLMASANHLMTVFLAVEMASVPSYVLAGILKGRRRSSEAATQVRRLRRRCRGRDALWHQPAGGPVGNGAPAVDRHEARGDGHSRDGRR